MLSKPARHYIFWRKAASAAAHQTVPCVTLATEFAEAPERDATQSIIRGGHTLHVIIIRTGRDVTTIVKEMIDALSAPR